MNFDPQKHHRRSIRLRDYDYSRAGAYFVTIASQDRRSLFGDIVKGEMILNEAGTMVDEQWNALPTRYSNIDLDVYQIMPDHFHGILVIVDAIPVDATLVVALQNLEADTKSPTLGNIVGAFKSITTNEYIKGVYGNKWPRFEKRLWQRNYYEHIIRGDADLNRIRNYIQSNPANWDGGTKHPNFR